MLRTFEKQPGDDREGLEVREIGEPLAEEMSSELRSRQTCKSQGPSKQRSQYMRGSWGGKELGQRGSEKNAHAHTHRIKDRETVGWGQTDT